MIFWSVLFYVDWLLFIVAALTTLYLGFFTITAAFARSHAANKSKHQNRIIVLIPAYKQDSTVLQTVSSILGQTYPQRLFDVTVISDHQSEMTNFRLAQQPVTLLTPAFTQSTKAKSLQLAINNLPQFKIYDVAVLLGADCIVENDFLEQINNAYESAGTKAIQVHRLSRNRDTATAHLSAIFEEINNTIFRRGHIAIGLSAAIAGSGMAFNFEWFKKNIMTINSNWEDKELEALLMRQHIFIDYFDDITIFEEKKRQTNDFNRQRGRWISTQFNVILRNIRYLPAAVLNKQYDWIDKIVQWMLVPRMILMVIIGVMSALLPFIYLTAALKWWLLFILILFFFALATPDYLVDKRWNSAFFKVPFILLSSVLRRFSIGKKLEASLNKKL